jgi:hypothetical protein
MVLIYDPPAADPFQGRRCGQFGPLIRVAVVKGQCVIDHDRVGGEPADADN